MKNKIYAISLLLSFLVVLSHDMIPHHHHDDLALDFSLNAGLDDHHNHYDLNEVEHHHKHDSQKEEKNSEHNHPFPFHQHISATNDVYIVRTNILESNTQMSIIALHFCTILFRFEFYKPPIFQGKPFGEFPFLITFTRYLEAFALRGPPSIV